MWGRAMCDKKQNVFRLIVRKMLEVKEFSIILDVH